MKLQAKIRAEAVIASHPEVEGKALFIRLTIDCPECGVDVLEVSGHHLRAIQEILGQLIEQYPDLTGEEAGLEVLQRMGFKGAPPVDPTRN